MPILHLPPGPDRPTQGSQRHDPGRDEILERDGALLRVAVGVARSMTEELVRRGISFPAPISGWGLLDTGACRTCVDAKAADKLGLPTAGWIDVTSATSPSSRQKIHPIRIRLEEIAFEIEIPHAIAAPLEGTGLVALIGRDVLRRCAVFYDGIPGRITLSC